MNLRHIEEHITCLWGEPFSFAGITFGMSRENAKERLRERLLYFHSYERGVLESYDEFYLYNIDWRQKMQVYLSFDNEDKFCRMSVQGRYDDYAAGLRLMAGFLDLMHTTYGPDDGIDRRLVEKKRVINKDEMCFTFEAKEYTVNANLTDCLWISIGPKK